MDRTVGVRAEVLTTDTVCTEMRHLFPASGDELARSQGLQQELPQERMNRESKPPFDKDQ